MQEHSSWPVPGDLPSTREGVALVGRGCDAGFPADLSYAFRRISGDTADLRLLPAALDRLDDLGLEGGTQGLELAADGRQPRTEFCRFCGCGGELVRERFEAVGFHGADRLTIQAPNQVRISPSGRLPLGSNSVTVLGISKAAPAGATNTDQGHCGTTRSLNSAQHLIDHLLKTGSRPVAHSASIQRPDVITPPTFPADPAWCGDNCIGGEAHVVGDGVTVFTSRLHEATLHTVEGGAEDHLDETATLRVTIERNDDAEDEGAEGPTRVLVRVERTDRPERAAADEINAHTAGMSVGTMRSLLGHYLAGVWAHQSVVLTADELRAAAVSFVAAADLLDAPSV